MIRAAKAKAQKNTDNTDADLKANDFPPEAETEAGLKMCLAMRAERHRNLGRVVKCIS